VRSPKKDSQTEEVRLRDFNEGEDGLEVFFSEKKSFIGLRKGAKGSKRATGSCSRSEKREGY